MPPRQLGTRLLRWGAAVLAALLLVPVLAVLLIGWLEITISAGPWREQIAERISERIGRRVTLEGPLELVPSLRPVLKIGGIRVANPPGFSSAEFAYLGQARLQVDLDALLHRVVRFREVRAENVAAQLERSADGRVNWLFHLQRDASPGPAAAPSGGGPTAQAPAVGIDVKQVLLRQVSLQYFDAGTGKRNYFQLDELIGEARRGEPLRVSLHGSVEKRFAYSLNFTGGTTEALRDARAPWPMTIDFEFLGTALHVDGAVIREPGAEGIDVRFGIGTEDLGQVERLLETKLPQVGAMGLSGRLQASASRVSLTELRGVMGRTTLEGFLRVDTAAGKPRIAGELMVPTLDLRPFLGMKPEETQEEPRSLLDTYRELERQTFSLRGLGAVDADVTLGVGRWLSLPGDVRDARVTVQLEQGKLHAPVQATIAGVALQGQVEADGAAAEPSFLLELGARRTQLGGLAELLAGVPGVKGELGVFTFRVSGTGENLGELTRTVDVRLVIDQGHLSYGNVEGGRPVDFRLDTLDIRLPRGKPLTGRVRGALLHEPFEGQFEAADLPTLAATLSSPVRLTARATGATLALQGKVGVTAPPREREPKPQQAGPAAVPVAVKPQSPAMPPVQPGTDLRLQLSAPRAGDVGRWLGLSEQARASLLLQGRIRLERDAWRLSDFAFRLGRTAMTGEFARVDLERAPRIEARLNVDRLDVEELESMLPPKTSGSTANAQATATPAGPDDDLEIGANTLDIPILPKGIDLTDADIEVRVRQVGRPPAEVTDASFIGRIRGGRMEASPFAAKIAGTPFSGAVALDLRGQVPEATLWVAANDVDVGQLTRNLKVAQELDAQVESLRVQLIGRGSRLGEMLERSALDVNLETGTLTVRDPNRKPLVTVGVKQGRIVADPGKPVTATIEGAIDQTPVAIRVATGAVPEFLRTGTKVPFSLNAEAARTQLELNGRMAVPVSQREGELELRISGERFDTLNQLLRVQLPAWGPWALGGRFLASNRGYEVPDLKLRIGSSTLEGRGSYAASGLRPRVDVTLTAPRIQLDDFQLGNWSPFEKQPKRENAMSVEEMRARAREAAAQGERLLSRETLLRMDAYVDVQVDQVLSGKDQLGSGKLHAQLADGRLDFGPAVVNVPGGSASLSAAYAPTDRDVAVSMQIRADRFDYGVLARRIKPDTDLQGQVSLRVDLDSRAPRLDAIMARANGRIDFAVWPRNMRSGIFDLWAVNLFVAMVPAVDPASESKVNCAIGRFDLRDGKLAQDLIVIDTSRMRVGGTGRVDFDSETLEFRLAPRAKTAQFFSLATPIAVSGKLTDYRIGVAPGGVTDTALRLLTSVIVVPIQKLTQGSVARDGADVCTAAMRDAERR